MEMTARLGLKGARRRALHGTGGRRNGDDSPVGIERPTQEVVLLDDKSRNGDDSPVGIESSSGTGTLPTSWKASKWR